MTLASGAIFGLLTGVIIVSFASSIGATLAFLVSRFILRDTVQSKFGDKLKTVNEGIEKDGAFYLFALRLVPAFPFFIINLVMGLTRMKTWTFYWVSQLGMLAGTTVANSTAASISSGQTTGRFQRSRSSLRSSGSMRLYLSVLFAIRFGFTLPYQACDSE